MSRGYLTKMIKVFLSHSSIDKDLARKIANNLKNNNIDVWFDEWEISVGESITQKISQGLENSNFVAVLLTKNSVNSSWVEKKWQSKIGEEASKKKVTILPLKADDCKIPQMLKDKLYADLSTNYQKGFKFFVDSLMKLTESFASKINREVPKKAKHNICYYPLEEINLHIINWTIAGNYIKLAYKCNVNPVTNRLMPTCEFFEEVYFYTPQK